MGHSCTFHISIVHHLKPSDPVKRPVINTDSALNIYSDSCCGTSWLFSVYPSLWGKEGCVCTHACLLTFMHVNNYNRVYFHVCVWRFGCTCSLMLVCLFFFHPTQFTSPSIHCVCEQHACVHANVMNTQLQFYERVSMRVGSAHAIGGLRGHVFRTQGGRDVGNSFCHQVLATCNPIWAVRMCTPHPPLLRLPGAQSATCAPLIPPQHKLSRWLTLINTRREVSAVSEVKLVPERREITLTLTGGDLFCLTRPTRVSCLRYGSSGTARFEELNQPHEE